MAKEIRNWVLSAYKQIDQLRKALMCWHTVIRRGSWAEPRGLQNRKQLHRPIAN